MTAAQTRSETDTSCLEVASEMFKEDTSDLFDNPDDAVRLKANIDKNDMSEIEKIFEEMLEGWKDVVINIGITGDSGTGKSSFINVIRGLKDDDDGAAKVDVKQTTTKPQSFPHPTNGKITFWDLPGIGTPNYRRLGKYCKEVKFETYDTFLIFAAGRFTEKDLELAKKIKSVGKKFFFIRTKIDNDLRSERKKRSFNEEMVLKKIRDDCSDNLSGLVENESDIFLISNNDPTKWEFGRLTQSILDVLPICQREALTLSLSVLTSMSTDILNRKIRVLRGRVWKVSAKAAAAALVPVPGFSKKVNLKVITKEVDFYKSQLCIPEEGLAAFVDLTDEIKQKTREFSFVTPEKVKAMMKKYSKKRVLDDCSVQFIPFVGQVIATNKYFRKNYDFLHGCLAEMEQIALSILDDIAAKTVDDFEND